MRLSFARIFCVPAQRDQCRVFSIVLSLILSACSDGSSNTAEIGEIGETDDTINGFHFVSSTSYNEQNQITRTTEAQYNLDLNRIDFVKTVFGADHINLNLEYVPPVLPDEIVDTSTHREYYDDAGRLTLKEWPSGSGFDTHVYNFNSAGLITTIDIDDVHGFSETYDFEYDASGDLVRVVRNATGIFEDNADALNVDTDTYVYNANGNLTTGVRESERYYNNDLLRTVTSTATFTYNSQGQRIQFDTIHSDEEGNVLTTINKYDSNGNLIERISQDWFFYERTVFNYEVNKEPIFNLWLLRTKFFPLR